MKVVNFVIIKYVLLILLTDWNR